MRHYAPAAGGSLLPPQRQARHVAHTNIVRDAWTRERKLTIHGWIYGLSDGKLRDLGVSMEGEGDVESACSNGLERLR